MNKHNIKLKSIISEQNLEVLSHLNENHLTSEDLIIFLNSHFNISSSIDLKTITNYKQDSSNMAGTANGLLKPKDDKECAIILYACKKNNTTITISAGRTSLNGGATPNGGIIISIEKMILPEIKVNLKNKTVESPVGIFLENFRQEVLNQSQKKLYYPVDPTSRKEALVGGTLACNASGFIPGDEGATRFWVEGIDFVTPDGYKVSCNRNQYLSKNGQFILNYPNKKIVLPVLTYPRPKIKNASGPFSSDDGKVDLVDFMIGSEGIFGIITKVTFNLKKMPNDFLNLFFTLPREKSAIAFHKYLSNYFNGNLSKITALEYFGYNSQNYMNRRSELFSNKNEVGIYLQIPLYKNSIEQIADKWFNLLKQSNCEIQLEKILILNDPTNWKMFFEARHSIPVNALNKTRRLNTISILTDTIVPPKNFSSFLNFAHKELKKAKIEYLLFGHLGDCHLHFHLIPNRKQQKKALAVYDKIVKISAKLGGVYSAEHGTGKRKINDFIECFSKDAVLQINNIKSILDPNFLLNRGNIISYKSI